ncbi:MAG: ATP-binding protein [Candidatus Woesearchaeota archaeon]
MAYEIVLGREEKEKEKFGILGTLLLGKHYVQMGQTTALAQNVYLDLNKAHVVFVCGKRGSGKSYCLGVIAEGIATLPEEYRSRLAVVLLDTMGIYWTMKYPNHKDEHLLQQWGMEGKGIPVKIFTPTGFFKKYKSEGIPTDVPFSIRPYELTPEDWNLTFDINPNEPLAVFIARIILTLQKEMDDYDIEDILEAIEADPKEEEHVKNAAINRFRSVEQWGVFSKEATPLKEIIKGGQISILDLSPYAVMPNGWKIKHLVIGLVAEKLFKERMVVRKNEEFQSIHSAIHYLITQEEEEEEKLRGREMPIVWLMIDEAHEFLPAQGKTSATDALITLLREGRQPGIAMVMATQQPGKIHTDAMTQSDIVLAHRLTAKVDTDAMASIIQSYLRVSLDKELALLPRVAGSCIAVDDVNERMYPMQIRPRFSWHGGGAPKIVEEKKKALEF